MPILFKCPKCQNKLTVVDEKAGSKLPCPQCGQRLQVPIPQVPAENAKRGAMQLPEPARPEARMEVLCPTCRVSFSPLAARAGSQESCPECGSSVTVPFPVQGHPPPPVVPMPAGVSPIPAVAVPVVATIPTLNPSAPVVSAPGTAPVSTVKQPTSMPALVHFLPLVVLWMFLLVTIVRDTFVKGDGLQPTNTMEEELVDTNPRIALKFHDQALRVKVGPGGRLTFVAADDDQGLDAFDAPTVWQPSMRFGLRTLRDRESTYSTGSNASPIMNSGSPTTPVLDWMVKSGCSGNVRCGSLTGAV